MLGTNIKIKFKYLVERMAFASQHHRQQPVEVK